MYSNVHYIKIIVGMFIFKLRKILLILFLFCITQCYKAPFFELNVTIQDQNFNPVPNSSVRIIITDTNTGEIIPNDLNEEDLIKITGSNGACSFSFEKKAFVTIQACIDSSNNPNSFLCQEAYVYLEENETITKTMMIVNDSCQYCPF